MILHFTASWGEFSVLRGRFNNILLYMLWCCLWQASVCTESVDLYILSLLHIHDIACHPSHTYQRKKLNWNGLKETSQMFRTSRVKARARCVPDPWAARKSPSGFKGMECFTLAVMEFNKNCIGGALRERFEGLKLHLDKKMLWRGREQRIRRTRLKMHTGWTFREEAEPALLASLIPEGVTAPEWITY